MKRWNPTLRPFALFAALAALALPARATLSCDFSESFPFVFDMEDDEETRTVDVYRDSTAAAGLQIMSSNQNVVKPKKATANFTEDVASFVLVPVSSGSATITVTGTRAEAGATIQFTVTVTGTSVGNQIQFSDATGTTIGRSVSVCEGASQTVLVTPARDFDVTCSAADAADHLNYTAAPGVLSLVGLDGFWTCRLTFSDPAGDSDDTDLVVIVTNKPPRISGGPSPDEAVPIGRKILKNKTYEFPASFFQPQDVPKDMAKLTLTWDGVTIGTDGVFTHSWSSATEEGEFEIFSVTVDDGNDTYTGWYSVQVTDSVPLWTDTTAPWAGLVKNGGIAQDTTFSMLDSSGDPLVWEIISGRHGRALVFPKDSVLVRAELEEGTYPFGWYGDTEYLRESNATRVPNPNLQTIVSMPDEGDVTILYFASYPYYHTVPGKGAVNGLNPVLTDLFGDFDGDGLSDTWEDYYFDNGSVPEPRTSDRTTELPVGIPTGDYGPTGNLDGDWLPTSLYQPAPDGARKIGWPVENPDDPDAVIRYRVYKYPLDFSTGGESYNKSGYDEKPVFGNFVEYRGLAEDRTNGDGEDPDMFAYYAPELVDKFDTYGPRGNCSGTDPENYDTDGDGFSDGWEFYFWTTVMYGVNPQNWRAWDPTYSLYRTASATAGIPLLWTDDPLEYDFAIDPTESYVIDPEAGTYQTTYEVDRDVLNANEVVLPVKPGSVRIVIGDAFELWTIPGRMTEDGYDALFYQKWADTDGDDIPDTPAVDDDGNPITAQLDGAWVDDATGLMHIPGWTVLTALADTGATADIDQNTGATVHFERLNGVFTRQHLMSRFDPMNWTETDMGAMADVVKGLGLDPNKWDPDSDLDGDGVLDIEEYFLGTDPLHWDTDRDGMPDGWEVQRGLLPRDPRNNVNGCGPGDNPDEDYMAVSTGVLGEAMPGRWTHIYSYLADLYNRRYWNGLSYVGFVPGRAATTGTPFSNREEFLVSLYGFQTAFWWDAWRLPLGYEPRYTDNTGMSIYALGIYPVDWPQTTSNPCDNDTNGNGIPDGWELYVGYNPIDGVCVTPLSFPPEADPDGDNLNLRQEFSCVEVTNRWPETRTVYIGDNATITQNTSTTVDADGNTNTVYSTTGEGTEVTIHAFELAMPAWTNKKLPTDPWNGDTDGDGLSDMQEYTDETDGNGDGVELANFNPCSADTDLDWLPDPWEYFMGTYMPDHPMGVSKTDPYGPFGDPDGDGLPNYQEYLTAANYGWRHDKWYSLDNQKIWIPQKRPVPDPDDKYDVLQGDWPYDPGLYPEYGPVVKAHQYQPMDFFAVPESSAWISEGIVALQTVEKRWGVTDAIDSSPSLHYETVAAFFQRLTEIILNGFPNEPFKPSKFMDDTRPSVDPIYNSDKVDIPGKKYFQYHSPEEHWAIVHAYEGMLGYLYSYAQCPYPWDTAALNNTPSGVPWTYIPLNDNTTAAGFPGTRPKELDSDHDNMPDYWEIYHGLNPCYGGCIAISDKAGSEADGDWDGADNWIMGNDPNFVLNLHLVPSPQPVSRFDHVWQDADGIKHTFGDGEDTAFGGIMERAHYDLVLRPWLAGDPSADADHDGVNNSEESYSVFANDLLHVTDPSPYWMTDITQTYGAFGQKASHVNLYYTSLGFGDDPADYWWWEQPYDGNDACNGPPTYLWDFEVNEGYDSDNDNLSDREELTDVSTRGKTDPQDLDSPVSRKAMFFDGYAACRTQRPFFHDQYALTSFTVEFWVRPKELPVSGKIASLLQRPVMMPVDTVSGSKAWDIRHTFFVYLDDKGKVCAEVDNDGIEQPANRAVVVSSGRLVPGVWTHVALVMDSQNDRLTLYLNGEQAGQIATSLKPCTGVIMDTSYQNWVTSEGGENGIETSSTTTVNFQYSPAPIVLGAFDTTPWSVIGLNPDATFDENRFYTGWLDEVRIWDRCRSQSEILNNMSRRFKKDDFAGINQERFKWDMENLYQTNSEDDFPQKLLYLFNFDNLPDVVPDATRDSSLVFASDTDPTPAAWDQIAATRPIPYVPWWYATKNRSTVYSTDYSYVPFIENVVSHLPQRPPRGVKELMPVFDGDWNLAGYRYRLSADWSEELEADIVAGEQVIGDVSYQYEENGAEALIRPNRLKNSMDPYGDTYSTGVSGGYEVNPWNFGGILDPYGVYDGVPLHSDMVPLLDAVADMDVPMWDGNGEGWNIVSIDSDGDGMPDWWEIAHGLDPNSTSGTDGAYGDADNDGLDNWAEYLAGTDPAAYDTDSDGYSDYYSRPDNHSLTFGELYDDGDGMNNVWEEAHGLDPNRFDSNNDPDGDGWTNWEEFMAGTDPCSKGSFPSPELSVTFDYDGKCTNTANLVVYSYGERVSGTGMGGAYDGKYTVGNVWHYWNWTFGDDGVTKVAGDEQYVTFLPYGHISDATLTIQADDENGTASQTYNLTRFNEELGYFIEPDVGLVYDTGVLFCSEQYVGKKFELVTPVDGYTFPFTADSMIRTPNTHLVGGNNRFLGFIDVNGNREFDIGEPMGLSVPRPTLVSWDSVQTEIPLTDELWDFPRISWNAATNGVIDGYNVVFQWVSKNIVESHYVWEQDGDANVNGVDDAIEREIAATLLASGDQAQYDWFTNAVATATDLYDALNPFTGFTVGEEFEDGDGMPASWEVSNGLDPYHFDGHLDEDSDGWPNYFEWLAATYPSHGRSFPQPIFEILVDYSGEGAAVTNSALWFQTYSAKRNNLYRDRNGDDGIEMGGWFDGVYTTSSRYSSVPDATGTGTPDTWTTETDHEGNDFFMADGVFGEDGKVTVQNIEFEVSYLPITYVKPSSMIGTALTLFDPENPDHIIAQGLFGTSVYNENYEDDGMVVLNALNDEVGIFQLQTMWGFAVTNLYAGEEQWYDSRTGVFGFGYWGNIEMDPNGKYKGLILFQYDTGALLTWGEFTQPGKRYAYRVTKAGGIVTGGFKFPAKVGGWYRLDKDALPVSMWYRADRVNHDHMVEGPNRMFGWSDVNGNGTFDMGEPAGLSLGNSFVAGQDSTTATLPLTDSLWGYPRLSWPATLDEGDVTYHVSFSYDRIPGSDSPGGSGGSSGNVWGDSDFDGLEDWIELLVGLSTNSAAGSPNDYYRIDPETGFSYGELYDDGDGIPSQWELRYGLDPYRYDGNVDTDDDGWSNYAEFMAGTEPDNASSYPHPKLSATFYYHGQQSSFAGLGVYAYGQKTHGGTWGGAFDGRYTSANSFSYGVVLGSDGSVSYDENGDSGLQGAFAFTSLEYGHVESASIDVYVENEEGLVETRTFDMQDSNSNIGVFTQDEQGSIFLEVESGRLLVSGSYIGKSATVRTQVDQYSFPVTFTGLVRNPDGNHTHMVEGPNRFFGWMDLDGDMVYDQNEPAGLGLYAPTLVGWDSAVTEIPLTDSVWDYPRVSWNDFMPTNFVPTDYIVRFEMKGKTTSGAIVTNETSTTTTVGIYGDLDGDGLDAWAEAKAGTDLNKRDPDPDDPTSPANDVTGRLQFDWVDKYGVLDPAKKATFGELLDDSDGMPSQWELSFGLDPHLFDADSDLDDDGWSNYAEFLANTDPSDPDDYPEPQFDVTFRYDGEANGASTLKVLSYSEKRHGTYIVEDEPETIYMGGLYDGLYTTQAKGFGNFADLGRGEIDGKDFGTSSFGGERIGSASLTVNYVAQENGTATKTTYQLQPYNDDFGVFIDDGEAFILLEYATGLIYSQFNYQVSRGRTEMNADGTTTTINEQVQETSYDASPHYQSRYTIEYSSSTTHYPFTIRGLQAANATDDAGAYAAHDHMVEGYNRFLGWMDLDNDNQWTPGEPMGLSLYDATLVGWDSVVTEIPLTDELFGFPRIRWDAPTNMTDVSAYRVMMKRGSTSIGPSTGIRVEAPRTFLHEGDYIEAGVNGVNLGSDDSAVYTFTVIALNDKDLSKQVTVTNGSFRLNASEVVSADGTRRAMSALFPTNNAVLHDPLVELRWKMDWRTEGVDITVKKGSTTVISEYVPFPVRHGRITDDDYYYSYVPQLKDGRSIVEFGAGNYTWTVKEHLNLSGYTKKTTNNGSFVIKAAAATTRNTASISGNVHYYGRLATVNNGVGVFSAGKVVVLAYKVSDRASSSLNVSGQPVAKLKLDGAGAFAVSNLVPGVYGLIGFVDANGNDLPDVGETQGMAFMGGSADPIQLPEWFKPIRIAVKDGAAVPVEDVHIVLRDRDLNGDGVPEIFDDSLDNFRKKDVVTVPATAATNWVSTAVFDPNFKPYSSRTTKTTSTSGGGSSTTGGAEWQFAIRAPRTFLHEGDLARLATYGFDLGQANAADFTWEVIATDGYHSETNSGGSFSVYAGTADSRTGMKSRWPVQMTVVHGSTVRFEWEMDHRNAGVDFKLENLGTGEVLFDGVVPFPVLHWDPTVQCYYYTAIPQMEDGLNFVDLPDGAYRWTVTERPNTGAVTPSTFTETFQLRNSENTRVTGSIEGDVWYYGRSTVDPMAVPSKWKSDLHVRAYRVSDAASSSASVGGQIVAEEVKKANGPFRLEGLEAGTYSVFAFVDSNGNGVADVWETQGFGFFGGNAGPVVDALSAIPITVTNGASVVGINVVLHDRDTDGDRLPDVWEYEKYGDLLSHNGYEVAVSNAYTSLHEPAADCLTNWIWKIDWGQIVASGYALPVRETIDVSAPRTFFHEGDMIRAGLYGLDLGLSTNAIVNWEVIADNGLTTARAAAGAFYLNTGVDATRRAMKAVFPVQNAPVYEAAVEFRWEMDWRNAGVEISVTNRAAGVGFTKVVPFPYCHGRVSTRDYWYTAVPQQESGVKFEQLPDGEYEYTIKEIPNSVGVTAQTVTERFRLVKGESKLDVGAISGRIHYYGRLLDEGSFNDPIVVQAWKVSDRARTSLCYSGVPAAAWTNDAPGEFLLRGLETGKYGIHAFVDANRNGVADDWETQGYGFLNGDFNPVQYASQCPAIVLTNDYVNFNSGYVAGKTDNSNTGFTGETTDVGLVCSVTNVNIVLRDRDLDSDRLPDYLEWTETGSFADWSGYVGTVADDFLSLDANLPGDESGFVFAKIVTTNEYNGVTTITTNRWGWIAAMEKRNYATTNFLVRAPRTFLHEGDFANAGFHGFEIGSYTNLGISWFVTGYGVGIPVSNRKADALATGGFSVSPAVGTDRNEMVAQYPIQSSKVYGNVVEFEWKMDWHNAGVEFSLSNLVTGEIVFDRKVIPFPIRHGRVEDLGHYYTATPQTEDGERFVTLDEGLYEYTITERPMSDLVKPQSITERFQLVRSGENRGLYSAEGTVRYYGKVMQREFVGLLGRTTDVTADGTFEANVDPSSLEPGAMGVLFVRAAATDPVSETTNNWYATNAETGIDGGSDWAEEVFNDSAANGVLCGPGTTNVFSTARSGTISYATGRIHLEFDEQPEDDFAIILVKKTFPCPLYVQAFKLPDSASTCVAVAGNPVAQIRSWTKGPFAVSNLLAGTYSIRAFLDSNTNGVADAWETQGIAVLTDTASPNLDSSSDPIVVRTDVRGLMIVLHDRDTDNDLLPDSWEWWKKSQFNANGVGDLLTSGYDVSEAGGLLWWQEYADGVLDSDPRTPDTDLDGLTDAMEILVTKTDTHLKDTDGDGVGDLEEFLSGSDPLDAAEAVPYSVPALAFDEAGVPYVDIAYPALKPGVVLTFELQRKLSLDDAAWETVAEHEVANADGAVFYTASDGVNDHMSAPGTARMLPADQAEGEDFTTGFYRIKVFADYGKMVDNGDGTWSYWTWVRTGASTFDWREAARGKGTLVRDADGNWSFVSDATGRKGILVRDEDGNWKFQN